MNKDQFFILVFAFDFIILSIWGYQWYEKEEAYKEKHQYEIIGCGGAIVNNDNYTDYKSDFGDPKEGNAFFKANCASCHKLNEKMTGPALSGTFDKYSEEWVYLYLKNPEELQKRKDKKYLKLIKQKGKNYERCNLYPTMSDKNMKDLHAYLVPPAL